MKRILLAIFFLIFSVTAFGQDSPPPSPIGVNTTPATCRVNRLYKLIISPYTLWTGGAAGACVVVGAGDVAGAASSTDNAIARFDGTGGKTIQNSGIIISDSNGLNCGTDGGCDIGNGLADFRDISLKRNLILRGSTSGAVTIGAAAVAGTWTLTLPANDGDSGQVLQTNGSGVTSWVAPSGGGSTFSSVLAYPSAATNIIATTWTSIPLNTEDHDDNSIHDNATNNTRFTVPSGATRCTFSGAAQFATSSTGLRYGRYLRNGATAYQPSVVVPSSGDFATVMLPTMTLSVTAGDYFEMQVYSSIVGIDANGGAGLGTFFSAVCR